MLLAVDVGNTNTVLGLYDGTELVEHWRVATNAMSTTDEVGVLYLSLFSARRIDPACVRGAIVACVVPPMVHAITRACRRYFDVDPLFVGPDVETGISIGSPDPREVGADRIVNAVAAWEHYRNPCIVVDFGTATTFDVIGKGGVYEGGVIAPGLGLSLEALFKRAAKLPKVTIERPERVIGHRTVESMQSGIVYGYCGLVDGLIARIESEMDEASVPVVATGGLAGLIYREADRIDRVEPMLTLEGLRLVWGRQDRAEAGQGPAA
ncbi:MAG: type III pantothenate kinase [Myxococcota bacterium]